MDAKKMSIKAIREGVSMGNYEITGVLETGEVTIAVLSDLEITVLNKIKDYEQLKKFVNMKGRPADEILQVYNEKYLGNVNRCIKNNLRIK